MNSQSALLKWLRLGRPSMRLILSAIVRSSISSSAALGLFIAAIALLVQSSHQVTLRSIAILLIAIELVAFVRSPLRFIDRLSAHRLGFAAVQEWRRTMTQWIVNWDDLQASELGHGEVLDRALADTEELQNLWLRVLLPGLNAITMLFLSALVLLLLPGSSWLGVLFYIAIVSSGAIVLAIGRTSLSAAEGEVREARGHLRNVTTEASRVAPALHLLKSQKVIVSRLAHAATWLQVSERRYERATRIQSWTLLLTSFGSLYITAHRFSPASLWQVVAMLVGLGTFDLLWQWQGALASALALKAAMARLEALEPVTSEASGPFPRDADMYLHDYWVNGAVQNCKVSMGARVAITGPSGAGKSTLLRVLAGMVAPSRGYVTIGGVPLGTVNQEALREFLTYVPTESRYVTGYVSDVVELGRDITRNYEADLQMVGLNWATNFDLVNPSRGERARLAVVRALSTTPAIVLLDEPTSGLGEVETRKLLALLDGVEATVIIATHDPQVMKWCTERIAL